MISIRFSFDYDGEIAPLASRAKIDRAYLNPNPKGWWLVATDGKVVVGTLAIVLSREKARFRSWYVVPEYRHKGVGKQLMMAGIDVCRERGLYEVEHRTLLVDTLRRWGLCDRAGKEYGTKYGSQFFTVLRA